jgi:hypothetical protein
MSFSTNHNCIWHFLLTQDKFAIDNFFASKMMKLDAITLIGAISSHNHFSIFSISNCKTTKKHLQMDLILCNFIFNTLVQISKKKKIDLMNRKYINIICKNIMKFFQKFQVGYTQTCTPLKNSTMWHPKRGHCSVFSP